MRLKKDQHTTQNNIVGAFIHITGVVQGVGFRPFIYQLATQKSLKGWVRNTSAGVDIDINIPLDLVDEFVNQIKQEAPPLARIDDIKIAYHDVIEYGSFEIRESQELKDGLQPISADVCICEDCLKELFDPADRRYRYPFINCTNCGPRFTIIKNIPYDRPNTTMADFSMCTECYEEYTNPLNRRFHAQPIACPNCGPKVWFEDKEGKIIAEKDEAIELVRELIKKGKIIAIKGLGGFHLACDATNEESVLLLRKRKLRVDKPFAVMAYSLDQVELFCVFNDDEKQLLLSKERPIILLKRKDQSRIVQEVAPYQNTIGVMLPYTPLHYLILEPQENYPYALVMTSGNLSEEPIAMRNKQAREQLYHLADGFLMHDREIYTRCDDSVVHVWKNKPYMIRRSRGYAPLSLQLPYQVKSVLAAGGELKNTFCITKDDKAFLSQHIGNLENYETYEAFEEAIHLFQKLMKITPEVLAYDKHPDYLATNYILKRGEKEGLPVVGVQHHHAHIAACMADNMIPIDETVIGVAFDGTGYGEDGAIWGGEFFIADYKRAHRVYHLSYVSLPGGEAAIKQPWRTAISWLKKANLIEDKAIPLYSTLLKTAEGEKQIELVRRMLEQEVNSPKTSSVGRLFDAVASILNIRQVVNYEAQAAIELENIAKSAKMNNTIPRNYPYSVNNGVIDASSIIYGIVEDIHQGLAVENIAYNFHYSIAKIVADICGKLRSKRGITKVALSGGVWQNLLLLEMTVELLERKGFKVLIHRRVPPNDGGISLGQAVIAAMNS